MKYIAGKNIEKNIERLRPKSHPNSPVSDKNFSTNITDMPIDTKNTNTTENKLNGSLLERSFFCDVKNFFFLKITLLHLVIKYGTKVTDKNSNTMLSKKTAICTARGTIHKNIKLQKLSLVASFLNMILTLFYILINTIISFIEAVCKGFVVRFTIFDYSI